MDLEWVSMQEVIWIDSMAHSYLKILINFLFLRYVIVTHQVQIDHVLVFVPMGLVLEIDMELMVTEMGSIEKVNAA